MSVSVVPSESLFVQQCRALTSLKGLALVILGFILFGYLTDTIRVAAGIDQQTAVGQVILALILAALTGLWMVAVARLLTRRPASLVRDAEARSE
jgi:hypothetical protein